ncbi:hypothetical protein BC940DRAFT_295897 [Gongronella butleri]|nr:hypothetical protein BC940DRAFT_295897 [Gongronella butleri]
MRHHPVHTSFPLSLFLPCSFCYPIIVRRPEECGSREAQKKKKRLAVEWRHTQRGNCVNRCILSCFLGVSVDHRLAHVCYDAAHGVFFVPSLIKMPNGRL